MRSIITSALALLAGWTSVTANASEQGDRLAVVLERAIDICVRHAVQQGGIIAIPAGANARSAIPELIKRFAQTEQAASFSSPDLYIQFDSADAEVWAVTYKEFPACSIVVANTIYVPDVGSALAARLEDEQHFQLWDSSGDDSNYPLWDRLFIKNLPKEGQPNFGIRLRAQSVKAVHNGGKDIQMNISVLAGNLKPPSSQSPDPSNSQTR